MIDKDKFIPVLLERIKKLETDHYIDVRSYKRNRSILVIKLSKNKFYIIENGFFKEEFQINFSELKQLFKKLIKKEFPRSHKIRVYMMGLFNKEVSARIKYKKL